MAPNDEDDSPFVTVAVARATWAALADLLASPSWSIKSLGVLFLPLFLVTGYLVLPVLLVCDAMIALGLAAGWIGEVTKEDEPPPRVTATAREDPAPKKGALRCAYCHEEVAAAASTCSDCGTLLHPACAAESAGCPTLGCSRAAPPRHRA